MAKKAVATFQAGDEKNIIRCIKMVKSPKTSAYVFKDEIMHVSKEKDFFKK